MSAEQHAEGQVLVRQESLVAWNRRAGTRREMAYGAGRVFTPARLEERGMCARGHPRNLEGPVISTEIEERSGNTADQIPRPQQA